MERWRKEKKIRMKKLLKKEGEILTRMRKEEG